MPDKRKHRGANPQDNELFGSEKLPLLRQAAADFSLLLTKNYPQNASLKLVGDKFALTDRQRLALMRSCCSNQDRDFRISRQVQANQLEGQAVLIDGYNLLITIEAAMSGAFIFIGRDGCFRDLAGLHGSYRKVSETIGAIKLIDECLRMLKTEEVVWILDRPVSNSGRLKKIIELETLKEVTLIDNPDTELKKSEKVVITSDSIVLDACKKWFNLAACIITGGHFSPKIVDLSQ